MTLLVYHHRHLVSTGPPGAPTLWWRPGVLTRSIIRIHREPYPSPSPGHSFANGTNLYSLSDQMSSHAKRWPYHGASGNHQLSSVLACQATNADGQANMGGGALGRENLVTCVISVVSKPCNWWDKVVFGKLNLSFL